MKNAKGAQMGTSLILNSGVKFSTPCVELTKNKVNAHPAIKDTP